MMGFTYIFLKFLEPLRMALLDVLAPKVLTLEKLCAFWYFASPLGLILLLDISGHLIFNGFFQRLAAEFADVNVIGLEQLQKLFLVCLDPVEGSLELLLVLSAHLQRLALLDRTVSVGFSIALGLLFAVRESFAVSSSSCSGLGGGC
jgi:hypothetical protein